MINREQFYASLRTTGLFTTLTDLQVQSIGELLNACDSLPDSRQVAYIMATAYHECHNPKKPDLRMTPMREFGGEKYLRSKKYYPYYGRGFSQLTWDYNYKKEGTRLGLPLLTEPDLILDIKTAANSHVFCMVNGRYTGKKLSDYINGVKCDYLNARRIINGTDRAGLVAGYAEKFLKGLV